MSEYIPPLSLLLEENRWSAWGLFVIIINLFMSPIFSYTISVQLASPLCQTQNFLLHKHGVGGLVLCKGQVVRALRLWVYGLNLHNRTVKKSLVWEFVNDSTRDCVKNGWSFHNAMLLWTVAMFILNDFQRLVASENYWSCRRTKT